MELDAFDVIGRYHNVLVVSEDNQLGIFFNIIAKRGIVWYKTI